MVNLMALEAPLAIRWTLSAFWRVYLNTAKTPKLRKDTQRRTKTRKDGQRRAKTHKDSKKSFEVDKDMQRWQNDV